MQKFIPLPRSRDDLSAKTFDGVTQVTLENLLKLPINKNLILPGLERYKDLTEPLQILQIAISPLHQLAAQAAQNLAQWLTWQDIALIWLAKASTPEAVPAAQILQQPNHATPACQQDNIAASANTPAQPTKLSLSIITKGKLGSQSNVPPIQHSRGR